jgi:cyclohexyl-isocyanide hydratase
MTVIGMILFDNLTQLDLTAPFEVFSRMPDTEILLISERKEAVKSDTGLSILSTTTFEEAPQYLDILFVPGGPGIGAVLENAVFLQFIKKQSQTAAYVTSVCTGSIILAAAGVLNGYKATTHWLSMDLLRLFDEVEVVEQRVVIDRNRMTGGGVTAGLDFGLTLAAEIFGDEKAKEIQLMLEYNPQPPFVGGGSPKTADPSVLKQIIEERTAAQAKRRTQVLKILSTI